MWEKGVGEDNLFPYVKMQKSEPSLDSLLNIFFINL